MTDPKPTDRETGPEANPGILDIAPYIGGEAKIAGRRPSRSASPRTRARSARAPRRWPPIARYADEYPPLSRRRRDGAARRRSARHHGLDPARIVCGAGSDELIGLLIRAYAGPGDEVLYSRHGFLMYPIGAQVGRRHAGRGARDGPHRRCRRDARRASRRAPSIVFIANPNNPTGTYLVERRDERGCMPGCRRTSLLAIDAAYAEFVNRNDYEPGIALVDEADNVVMLRTFSKIYALAGLRLGWAYCPPAIADVLNRVRGPVQRQRRRRWPPASRRSRTSRRSTGRARITTAGCPGCPSG